MRKDRATLLRIKRNSNELRQAALANRVYNRTHTIWQILFASVIVDPIVDLQVVGSVPTSICSVVATICAVSTFPFLAQRGLQQAIGRLRQGDQSRVRRGPGVAAYIGVIAVATALSLKFAGGLTAGGVVPLLILGFILFNVIKTSRTILREQAKTRDQLLRKPALFVRRWEDQLIVITAAPMMLARAVGLIGIFDVSHESLNHLIYFVCGATLLAMLRPQRNLFRGYCKRCKQPVSVAIQSLGSCPRCNPEIFIDDVSSIERAKIIA